jgi:glutamate/tyrosine decarboxylase-like PLP-dependent enzyme
VVIEAIAAARINDRPFSGADPPALARTIAAIDPCPEEAVEFEELLAQLGDDVLAHGVNVSDPRCVAHLECPTLLSAAAAELAIGATTSRWTPSTRRRPRRSSRTTSCAGSRPRSASPEGPAC